MIKTCRLIAELATLVSVDEIVVERGEHSADSCSSAWAKTLLPHAKVGERVDALPGGGDHTEKMWWQYHPNMRRLTPSAPIASYIFRNESYPPAATAAAALAESSWRSASRHASAAERSASRDTCSLHGGGGGGKPNGARILWLEGGGGDAQRRLRPSASSD